MKTLKDLVIARKIRTGKAHGTTSYGAYWLVAGRDHGVQLRRAGGDGIGNNPPNITYWLDLRHYRSGEVAAIVDVESWHQNYGHKHRYIRANAVLNCSNVEDVVVALKGIRDSDGFGAVYSDRYAAEIAATLEGLGLPLSAPSPDEA